MVNVSKKCILMDLPLQAAGGHVCDMAHVGLRAAQDMDIREFPLSPSIGFDYDLRFVDGKACGEIEVSEDGCASIS